MFELIISPPPGVYLRSVQLVARLLTFSQHSGHASYSLPDRRSAIMSLCDRIGKIGVLRDPHLKGTPFSAVRVGQKRSFSIEQLEVEWKGP